jgi:hypothetical protein
MKNVTKRRLGFLVAILAAGTLTACELVVDFDRTKIADAGGGETSTTQDSGSGEDAASDGGADGADDGATDAADEGAGDGGEDAAPDADDDAG